MVTFPSIPHCRTCSCVAPPPSRFTSDVRLLPVDLDRQVPYTWKNGKTESFHAMAFVEWKPSEHQRLKARVRAYRSMLHLREARNVREAVKMLTAARREWSAAEAERYAGVLRRKYRSRKSGYERALAWKKAMIRAEGGPCTYCGDPDPGSVDHIIPTSRGGDHRRRNLTICCLPCSSEKSYRTPDEWKAARLAAGLPWPPLPRTSRKAS